jgi:hypothetical protein
VQLAHIQKPTKEEIPGTKEPRVFKRPGTKGRKAIPKFEKAQKKGEDAPKPPSLISKIIPFADRIALPRGSDGKWEMFPSRTPKQQTPPQIPSTLHLVNYLTNKLINMLRPKFSILT